MSLRFHWFLPTNGDGRDIVGGGHGVAIGAAGAIRPPSVKYLGQIARSAEQLGFEGALTPTGAWCEDAWLTCAMLTEVTERLKFLVAFRPGQISPTLSAQMASTFQRQSQGRLLLNVVTGGESAEQRAYGDFLDKDQRYERTGEFLDIVTRLWRARPSPTTASTCRWRTPSWPGCPTRSPTSTSAARQPGRGPGRRALLRRLPHLGRAAERGQRQAPLDRSLAAEQDRKLRLGIRLHTISRDTSEEAWRQAGYLMERVTDDMIAKVQTGLATSESEGQRRMRALHDSGGRRGLRDLEIHPNLWAGVGLVRGGAGTSLVGSHEEVAEPDRGVRRTSASPSSSSPATRTWRRRTGSARACCPSSNGAASGVTRPRPARHRRPSPRSPPTHTASNRGPPHHDHDRRRHRQPQAELPHPFRRGGRFRPAGQGDRRRAPIASSSTWPTTPPGCSTGPTPS